MDSEWSATTGPLLSSGQPTPGAAAIDSANHSDYLRVVVQ